jgi:hypothetical protein
MTEEEARQKWCPHVRVASADDATVNRGGAGPHEAICCIASACMAWRWDVHSSAVTLVTTVSDKHGHCGLAGQQEPYDLTGKP